jgi:hypothetical protein
MRIRCRIRVDREALRRNGHALLVGHRQVSSGLTVPAFEHRAESIRQEIARQEIVRALLRNDRDWLLAFNRSHRSWRPKSSCRVIEPTTEQVREAWQELMLVEPPVWATRVAVLERIGFRGQRDRSRPFAVLLAKLAESHSAYQERVISWLATLASERRLDTCDDALRRAGMRQRAFTREQRSRIQEIDLRVVSHCK